MGLIYFCIGYNGFLSLLPWDWRPGRNSPMFDSEALEGLGNYAAALQKDLFWTCLKHTLIFFLVAYVVQCLMGIIFAAILHSKVYLGTLWKVIIFIPVVVAPAIMAPVHRRVFAVDGPINWILQHLGLINVDGMGNRNWTGWLSWLLNHIGLSSVTPNWIQPSTSLWVIIAVQIWGSIGMAFILFFAAMGQIEPEILEAARIDGAGNIRVLWSVIVPNLKPTIVSLAILNAITALKLFDQPYLITAGGPAHSSEFLGTYIYGELFQFHSKPQYGGAATLSIMLLVLAVGCSIIMSAGSRGQSPAKQAKKRARLAKKNLEVAA
ncbi:MAG: sugar ABC transporter permease [Bifidobacteriaceae bacterium]|nr:sugar ABC transporter permease [Bifidobacteriaceae bacterium]